MARLNRVSLAVAALLVIAGVACKDDKPEAAASEQPVQLAAAPKAAKTAKPKAKKKPKKKATDKKKFVSSASVPPAGFLPIKACGARLRPTDKLFVASDDKGEQLGRTLELAEDTQAVRDALAAKKPGAARPEMITVTTFARAPSDKIRTGVEQRYAADPKRVTRRTELAGARTFFTQAKVKGTKLDVVTIGCDDAIVELTVPVTKPDSELRKEFARLLSSLKFSAVPPQQLNGGCKPPSDGCASPMLAVCKDAQWACAEVETPVAADKPADDKAAADEKPAAEKPAAADKAAPGKSAAAPGKAKAEKAEKTDKAKPAPAAH